MSLSLKQELRRLLVLAALAAAVGYVVGEPLWVAGLFAIVYLGWQVEQLARVLAWLRDGARTDPPDTMGIWEEIVSRVHRIQQRSRKRKKRLSKMLNRFQKSTQAMPDATVVLKASGEIEWVNRASEELLGLSRSDAGQHITNLLRDPMFGEFLLRGDFDEPVEVRSPVDEDIVLSVRLVRFAGKQLLLTARDVTRINRLEAMRKDFVANVSHELRTPLTVLGGYLEALNDARGELPQALQGTIPPMLQQTRRMNSLVSDLLFLSRLEQGDMDEAARETAPVDVPAILRSVIQNAEMLSGEDGHRIECGLEGGLWLLGSHNELESAFANLVSNAVRYTPAGGRINLLWWSDEAGAHLSVSDTGIGIDEEDVPHLTERFFRVDRDRSRQSGGTGLGLAIVKHVLARHDAALEVESQLEIGTEFRCDFPPARIVRRDDRPAARREA